MHDIHSDKRCAFTMLEILATFVILGIVAAILVPRWTTAGDEARQQAYEKHKMEIDEAVERYYINENQWPSLDLSDIGADPNYFPKGVPNNPIDGSRYTLNPTTHRVE